MTLRRKLAQKIQAWRAIFAPPHLKVIAAKLDRLDKRLASIEEAHAQSMKHVARVFDDKLDRLDKRLASIEKGCVKPVTRIFNVLDDKTDQLGRRIDRGFTAINRNIRNYERENYQQLTQYMELRRIFDSDQTMPPLRGYAISPDLAFFLLELLERYRPKRILEFGSGFSSIVLSRYAHRTGAKVVSVDHEASFAQKSRANVEAWGYGDCFQLIMANVIEHHADGKRAMFYDQSALDSLGGFDFVFLDGPPQKLGTTVRGGLLPLYRPMLTTGCIVVLDDYYRPGEREVVSNWLQQGFVELVEENEFLEKHAAVLRVL